MRGVDQSEPVDVRRRGQPVGSRVPDPGVRRAVPAVDVGVVRGASDPGRVGVARRREVQRAADDADRVEVLVGRGQAAGGAVEVDRPGAVVVVDDVLVLDRAQAGQVVSAANDR